MAKVRFIIGVLISLAFLYLALSNVDFSIVAKSLKHIAPLYLFLCVICQFASLSVRAYLWKNILAFEKDVRYCHSFEALLIGYMGNNILPFRMGELMRAYAMGEKEGISRTLSFASIVLERLLDLFILLLFFTALLFLMRLEAWIVFSGIAVSLFLILSVLCLYALATDFLRLPSAVYGSIIKRLPAKLAGAVENIADSFVRGIKLIRGLRQLLRLVFLSILSWILWTAVLYFGLKAFYLELPVAAALLLSVVINIGVMIPSSPGFIGVFQYLCIVSLSFFGISKEVALSFSFLVHAIQYIPTTALGWFYLLRMHIADYHMIKKGFADIIQGGRR